MARSPLPSDHDTAITASATKVLALRYQNLVAYSAADNTQTPGMADRWETSPDGKVWTFNAIKSNDPLKCQPMAPFGNPQHPQTHALATAPAHSDCRRIGLEPRVLDR